MDCTISFTRESMAVTVVSFAATNSAQKSEENTHMIAVYYSLDK